MNYARATVNWGHAASRATLYGAISLTGGLVDHRVSQWAMHRWCAGTANGLKIRRELRHGERLQTTPQCVLVANHLSTLDILVLGSYLRRDYRWLAKAELFKVPIMGWHLALAGHVPVHRGERRGENADIARRIHKVVEDGASLLFFPEGTRSEDGQLKPFRIGAFMTAATEGLPVLPLVIRGTHELMEKGAGDLAVDRSRRCSVTVLEPLSPPAEGDPKDRADALMAATHAAMRAELARDLPGP